MKFTAIAYSGPEGGMGIEGRRISRIRPDKELLLDTISNKCVVMGWNTAKSLGGWKPLTNCCHIIILDIDRVLALEPYTDERRAYENLKTFPNVHVVSDMFVAEKLAEKCIRESLGCLTGGVVYGGATTIALAILCDLVDTAILTIDPSVQDSKADVFFPSDLLSQGMGIKPIVEHTEGDIKVLTYLIP